MAGVKGRTGKYKKTESHKKNLSISLLNHKVTKKTRNKISKANKGNKSWCKGLTKETSEIVRKIAELNTGKKFSNERKECYKKYWNSKSKKWRVR